MFRGRKDLKEKTKTKKPGTKTKSSSPVKKGDGKSKPLAASPKPGALKESSDKVSRVASPKKKESVEKATKTTTTPEVKATRGEEKDKETKNAANASASKSAKTATAGRWGHLKACPLLCLSFCWEDQKWWTDALPFVHLPLLLKGSPPGPVWLRESKVWWDPSGGISGLMSFWTAAVGLLQTFRIKDVCLGLLREASGRLTLKITSG